MIKLDQNEYEQLPKLCTVQDIRTITSAYIDEVHTFVRNNPTQSQRQTYRVIN